mgnify:CR=1 FL=1
MIEDEVFGKLTFDYTWFRYEKIIFCGEEKDILILVAGEEDGKFDEGQYEAYRMLKSKWVKMQEGILESILDYYKNKRKELGYDEEWNEAYTEIVTTKDLLNYIILVSIKIPYADIYGGRSIGLSFDCTWDDENGLGIQLCDEHVVEVGYQDIGI